MSINPFVKTEVSADSMSIRFYGKKGATWEQMNAWMESNWSDPAYTWKGFGKAGEEDFVIVLLKRDLTQAELDDYGDASDDEDEEEEDDE
jgi:hypothetical protein